MPGRPQGHEGGPWHPGRVFLAEDGRAEVQSSRRNSYGASIPLMEGVRDVVGEVSVVTGTTLTGP